MEPTPFAPTPIAERASLRRIYLRRLRRLQQLRQRHERELNHQGLRLLDRSVFAAFCDCRDVGAEAEAREILNGASCSLDPGGEAGGPSQP